MYVTIYRSLSYMLMTVATPDTNKFTTPVKYEFQHLWKFMLCHSVPLNKRRNIGNSWMEANTKKSKTNNKYGLH